MRGNIAFLAGLAAILAFTPDANAQRGGGRFGGGRGMGGGIQRSALLRLESVQEELGLEEATLEEIQAMRRESREARGQRGDRPNFRDMSDEERATAMAEFREAAAKRQKEQNGKMAEILGSEKMTRLNEIYLQVAGTSALRDAAIGEKLGISEEQQNDMRQAARDAMSGMRELMQSGDRDAMREKMTEMRATAEKNALAVLSAEQLSEYESMKGEAFALSDEDRQSLTRGGRGRRGGGGGGQRRGRPPLEE